METLDAAERELFIGSEALVSEAGLKVEEVSMGGENVAEKDFDELFCSTRPDFFTLGTDSFVRRRFREDSMLTRNIGRLTDRKATQKEMKQMHDEKGNNSEIETVQASFSISSKEKKDDG